MKKNSVRQLTISALLIGLGIIIPMVMPKIVIGPASFTLASHVPLFIAMFFSPGMAVTVALGTTFGFLVTGLPVVIALRAFSHLIFAVIGAMYLQRHPGLVLQNGKFTLFNLRFQTFNFLIGVLHAIVEMLVVMAFNFVGNVPASSIEGGAFYFFFVLLGVGGLIHSLVDYSIAYFVAGTLSKHFELPVFVKAKQEKTISGAPRTAA